MTQPSNTELDPSRHQLLMNKFGDLLEWTVPDIRPTIGPHDPSVFLRFESKRLELIDACRSRLRTYSSAELATLLEGVGFTADIVIPFWNSFLAQPIQILREMKPVWYAAGFGHPDHAADFEYWAKMPGFNVSELTCLSIGIEPGLFPKEKVLSIQKKQHDKLWPAAQFLLRRHEQLKRKFDPRNFDWQVQPITFIDWAASVNFETHPVFLRLLRQYHPSDAAPPPSATKAGLADKREVDTIAKIITVLAIQKFRYEPKAARSEVPKKIVDLAAASGIEISEETVLKYLRRGATFVPKAGQSD